MLHLLVEDLRNLYTLFFVKEKGLADKMLRDCFDHVINVGEQFFRGYYLKLVRSRNSTAKQFEVIERELLIPPDEINDTYLILTTVSRSTST